MNRFLNLNLLNCDFLPCPQKAWVSNWKFLPLDSEYFLFPQPLPPASRKCSLWMASVLNGEDLGNLWSSWWWSGEVKVGPYYSTGRVKFQLEQAEGGKPKLHTTHLTRPQLPAPWYGEACASRIMNLKRNSLWKPANTEPGKYFGLSKRSLLARTLSNQKRSSCLCHIRKVLEKSQIHIWFQIHLPPGAQLGSRTKSHETEEWVWPLKSERTGAQRSPQVRNTRIGAVPISRETSRGSTSSPTSRP